VAAAAAWVLEKKKSHDSPVGRRGQETQSRSPGPILGRKRPGGRRSHVSLMVNPGRETQSRLARGQPRAGDAVTTRPRPTSGGRHSHNSSEANPGQVVHFSTRSRPSWVMLLKVSNSINQLCKALGERCSHDSPESTPEQETQSRPARGWREMQS
jgi:hypothetical protein